MRELEFVGLRHQALTVAKNPSYGDQRRLEIARALATRPRLLILDEPAGGMNEQETEALIGLIGQIRARGITILLIEHDMRLVMRACEKLVVLEYGGKIAEGPPEQVRRDPTPRSEGDRGISRRRGWDIGRFGSERGGRPLCYPTLSPSLDYWPRAVSNGFEEPHPGNRLGGETR